MNWIPIKDRIPSKSGYYLVTWGMFGDKRQKRVSEMWFDGEFWFTLRAYIEDGSSFEVIATVMAWMEKPKPYRGKSK